MEKGVMYIIPKSISELPFGRGDVEGSAVTIDEGLKLLERLERNANKSLQRKALISAVEIERLRRLLSNLRT